MLSSRNRRRLFRAGFATLSGLRADRWLAPASRGTGLIGIAVGYGAEQTIMTVFHIR